MPAPPTTTPQAAHQIGSSVRQRLGPAPLPGLLLQSHFSFHAGTVSPEHWAAALTGLHGQELNLGLGPGGNHVGDPHAHAPHVVRLHAGAPDTQAFAALCDRDDLAGLPAAIASWGQHRVAVGVHLILRGQDRAAPTIVVLLAPDASAYATLCQFLSWRAEDPAGWDAWQAAIADPALPLDGILALPADPAWVPRLERAGAETFRWASHQPINGGDGAPVAALPLLTSLEPLDTTNRGLLAWLRGSGPGPRPLPLSQLPDWLDRFSRAPDQVDRGHRLLDRCRYHPGLPDADGRAPLHMPPRHGGHAQADAELRALAQRGLRQRSGGAPTAVASARLERELTVIAAKRFSSYILTVWELAQGRRTCGRGSAASSLVCYAIGLTNVDPVRYHLLFERFLAPERTDPPDIDIDFPWDERDAVLTAAIERYGREHVAMVSTHQTLQERGAWREAGRMLGRGSIQEMSDTAESIIGLPRHYGLHCGGVVIVEPPIRSLVPVHPAAKCIGSEPLPAIAWEKDGAEALGLIKIDFLGNRSLAVVRDALSTLTTSGVTIDPVRWSPADDPSTLRLVREGQTIGCFYIESPATRLLNAKAGHIDFDRLVIHSSIIRPAAATWVNTYLERLHAYRRDGRHREDWYPHPAFRDLLSEAFGVLCYQEDVMLLAERLAGFSSRGQNALRKALGRSDTAARLAPLAGEFTQGCRTRGVEENIITLAWSMITSFAGYSFCKAHSASYVAVSFQCAYLKAHHPAHFMAAVIDNEGGFYHRSAYVEEARRCGVTILPPCVVHGACATRPTSLDTLRLGLRMVHGLHLATAERICAERQDAAFAGVTDFIRRCRPSRRELRMLLWAGALAALAPEHDADALRWIVAWCANQQITVEDKGQAKLTFDRATQADPQPPATVLHLSQRDHDWRSYRALGCLPRAHPLMLWPLPHRRHTCSDVATLANGRWIELYGRVITSKQVMATQAHQAGGAPRSTPMGFVTLEDDTGVAETVWFPTIYRRYRSALDANEPLWIRGRIQREYDVPTLIVDRVRLLEHVPTPHPLPQHEHTTEAMSE